MFTVQALDEALAEHVRDPHNPNAVPISLAVGTVQGEIFDVTVADGVPTLRILTGHAGASAVRRRCRTAAQLRTRLRGLRPTQTVTVVPLLVGT